jgi:HK97 family phage major capsid protein
MFKSKAMKKLEADLAAKQKEAQELMNKADATEEQMNAVRNEIKAIKGKIELQKELDEGKIFDENGEEVIDRTPVNEPLKVPAQANSHKGPFNSFGEQCIAVMQSSAKGAAIDERLLKVQNATGANEAIPSEGGFLVQQDFAGQIAKDVFDTGVLLKLCSKMEVSAGSNGIKMNGVDESSRANGARWGGVQAYWANEAATVTASKPKFREIELKLNKLFALYYSTDELLADAVALNSVLTQAFTEEIQFKADDAIINGDGAGKPLGIMNAGCLVEQAKEAGQAADTIVHENISNMWSRMPARRRANAVWLINQELEPGLEAMALAIGTAGTLSPLAIEYMTKGTIKGRPVLPIEQCAAIGDKGDIVLADFGSYLLADKNGMQMASSMHIMFLYDEMAFRITYRLDGQPVRDKAITPYKGTSGRTLSPFVTLAAR